MRLNNYRNSFAPPFHWQFDDKTIDMISYPRHIYTYIPLQLEPYSVIIFIYYKNSTVAISIHIS